MTGAFAGAKQVRVTHPNGTDLRFGVEGRPVILSDGVITPEQAAKGGASAILYLPAGEAQVAPVPGTAEGKVVIDRMDWGIGPVEKLTWTFRAGKLVEYTAKPGPAFTRWKELYEAAPGGKDAFAGIDSACTLASSRHRGSPSSATSPRGWLASSSATTPVPAGRTRRATTPPDSCRVRPWRSMASRWSRRAS